MASDETAAQLIERIAERLRRDHPDPELRAQLYADGKLPDYVRTLMNDADPSLLDEVVAGVHAAEDGTPAHDE